ncbi:hypothetical protein M5K25_003612 [Dendrobium thyrsiflorum]|uniref:Uroporphyrinogen decarboxylase (URO-D) domain-containing protein n=1 Tax=Dendrobium thyrsiflorum TaxID=117978 RepID=A0ABD0VKP3_DENTH
MCRALCTGRYAPWLHGKTLRRAVPFTVDKVVRSAGRRGHILNLGHGVLVKTPEEAVAHFFDVVKGLRYDSLFKESMLENLEPVA